MRVELGKPKNRVIKRRRSRYSDNFRSEVVAHAGETNDHVASIKFGVSPHSVRNWRIAIAQEELSKGKTKIAKDTRNTIAEDTTTHVKPMRRGAPLKAPASADMIDFFAGKKACCVECGEANSAGFRGFIERNTSRNLTDFHCISCGAVLTDSLMSHYEQNK